MTEAILGFCAFITLINVSTAAFIACLFATTVYKQNKAMDLEIATLPKRTAERINQAVAEFSQVYKQVDKSTWSDVMPVNHDESNVIASEGEFDEWYYKGSQ